MYLHDIIDFFAILAVFLILALLIGFWVIGYRKWNKPSLESSVEPHSLCLKANLPPCYIETIDLGIRTITAYSSAPEETDDTPFITASGKTVRNGIIATNELAFGTLVKIDGKIYEVQDRMATKNNGVFDIWMPSKQEALDWGKKTLRVELAF